MPGNFAGLHWPFPQHSRIGDSATLCLTNTQDLLPCVSRRQSPDLRQFLPLSCLNQIGLTHFYFLYESHYKCFFIC